MLFVGPHRTVEQVDVTMDSIREQMEVTEQISLAISGPITSGADIDEDELEQQLQEMETDVLNDRLMGADHVPVHTPADPAAPARVAGECPPLSILSSRLLLSFLRSSTAADGRGGRRGRAAAGAAGVDGDVISFFTFVYRLVEIVTLLPPAPVEPRAQQYSHKNSIKSSCVITSAEHVPIKGKQHFVASASAGPLNLLRRK